MNLVELSTWEEFEREILKLQTFTGTPTSPLIYRGHSDSAWKLTTTLDRNDEEGMKCRNYYELVCGIGPEIGTLIGVNAPRFELEIANRFSDPGFILQLFDEPVYRYMAYLRHLGFPSPLLDWSESPYVAAFFAFREMPRQGVDKVSIYAYCERPSGGKGGRLGDPMMTRLGPYIQTHHRHFRQRCEYTICVRFDTAEGNWFFDLHEKVFENTQISRINQQDSLWKFNLPSSLRETALKRLHAFNVNAFSVFGSEESLLETLWFKEHVLRQSSFRDYARRKAALDEAARALGANLRDQNGS